MTAKTHSTSYAKHLCGLFIFTCWCAWNSQARALSVNLQARSTIGVTTERTARGIHMRGVLSDDRGAPIASELIRVQIKGLTLPTVSTDAKGAFEYFIPARHLSPLSARHGNRLAWTVAFLGDPRYGPSQRSGTLDLGRESASLELSVSEAAGDPGDPWTIIHGKLRGARERPVGNAPVFLKVGRGREQQGDTDAKGIVRFRVRLADLGVYGALKITARFEGDARLAPAQAETSVNVQRPTRITLRVGREGDAATGRYRFSGRLIDAAGPIEKATVAIIATDDPDGSASDGSARAVAVAVTNSHGLFITALRARTLFPDNAKSLRIRAIYQPQDKATASSESRQVAIPVPSSPGIPLKWYFAGLLWLLAGLGAVYVIRHRVLNALAQRWSNRRTSTAPFSSPPDILEVPFHTPAASSSQARRNVVAGVVVDAHTGHPVSYVRISIVSIDTIHELHTHEDGRFEFGPMRPDTYSLTMDSDGYLNREVEITIPHEGYLDGGTFSLIATRRRLRELYGAALKRLGKTFVWGKQTPREAWLEAQREAHAAGAHTSIERMRDLTERAWFDRAGIHQNDVREARTLLKDIKGPEQKT